MGASGGIQGLGSGLLLKVRLKINKQEESGRIKGYLPPEVCFTLAVEYIGDSD
jgi:hypothetical protein